jgi:TonB family protein
MNGARGGSSWLLIALLAVGVQPESVGEASSPSAQAVPPSSCGRVVAVTCEGPSSAVTLLLAGPGGSSNWRAVIPHGRRHLFGPRIEERYEQQLVCGMAAPPSTPRAPVFALDPSQLIIKDATQTATALPDDVYRTCDPDVELPKLVRSIKPQMTANAMRAKVNGRVVLRGVVDRAGTVRDVQILQALEPSLDISAREVFERWEFRPGSRNGEPVAVAITVEMAFTMR